MITYRLPWSISLNMCRTITKSTGLRQIQSMICFYTNKTEITFPQRFLLVSNDTIQWAVFGKQLDYIQNRQTDKTTHPETLKAINS